MVFYSLLDYASISPSTYSLSISTLASPETTVIAEQQPGTFALLYENETEKMYSYRVKIGGIPDGVGLRYIQVFSFPKSRSNRIFIQDISGAEFLEDRWLLSGEIIYVSVTK